MSSTFTTDDVRHIASLAKLHISPAEAEKFSSQLSDIVKFVDKLDAVDTTDVEETSQVTGLENVWREDVVDVGGMEDAILSCSPHEKLNHSIKIEKIL